MVDIKDEAIKFRQAIENTKFSWRDRMNNFPGGCCDDTCDLFYFYLLEKYHIHTHQRVGYYEKKITNHVWLIFDDGMIADLTGDQFPGWPAVYYGAECERYDELKDKRDQENFDIRGQDRLWNDYQRILMNLK